MINTNGVIQNNKTASDFIRKQRKYNKTFKVLSKEEEREMVEKYARLKLDENGDYHYNDKYECDFEWIGDETEFREKLAMHNLQMVTKTSAKHCQDTRDYDNMYAKGLYGLTIAANKFHPFRLNVKNGVIQTNEDGSPAFIKFSTLAQTWIFKYVMDEFYQKSIKLDNNSTSLNELARIHNGTARNMTLENYLSNMLAPELEAEKSVAERVEEMEISSIYDSIYDSIHNYIVSNNAISSLEKDILEETFYNGNESPKKLSAILGVPQKLIIENRTSALGKLKEFLFDEYGIESLSDVL